MSEIRPEGGLDSSTVRRLTGRSMIFASANFLQMGIAFLLIPVYTAHLAPADYGVLSIATTVAGILTILYLQPMEGAMTRLSFDLADEDRRRELYATLWLFQVGFSAAASVCVELLAWANPGFAIASVPWSPYLRLVVWTTFVSTAAFLLPRALFLFREQAWRYASLNLGLFVLTTACIVYFVVLRAEGAAGSLRGTFLATVAVAIPATWVALRNVRPVLRATDLRAGLAFALPMVPHLLSLWALNLSDRLILTQFVPLSDVGVYTLGYQIGAIPQIVAVAVSTAINPFYFRVAATGEGAPRTLAPLMTWYVLLIALVGVGTVATAPDLLRLVGARADYLGAERVLPWVVAGSVARAFYFVFVAAVYHSKNLSRLPLVTIASALVNVALNFALIPRFGIMAAAVTTFLAYAFQAVLLYRYAQRSYRLPYQWERLTILAVAFCCWTIGLTRVQIGDAWAGLAAKAAIALAFPAALWLLGFFPAEERRKLREALFQPGDRRVE